MNRENRPSTIVLFTLTLLQASIRVTSAVPARSEAPLPVKAEQLMPMEPRQGIYLVTEGPDKGKQVPFTLEQRGDSWILTKEGLTWHELKRDDRGNILILRESDLRDQRQVDYDPPIVLLPFVVDENVSTMGKTHVTIRNTQTGSVMHRGDCKWQLNFIGLQPREIPAGTFLTYHLQATRQIRLALTETTVTIDFDYVLGKGMVATGFKQVIRFMGLSINRTTWRLEQLFT